MVQEHMRLTAIDQQILESYRAMCDGLTDYLGTGYEIVLHSLENLDHSVIKICNGYHTGRSEGAPITDLALQMLGQIKENNTGDFITYFAKNKCGEPLKSSTICIRGENNRVIGLLCINFYLNMPMSQWIKDYSPEDASVKNNVSSQYHENYVNDVDELIAQAITQVRPAVLDDVEISASNKNREMIRRLAQKGIFNLKDGVIRCARMMGISKNTVYMHLRNLEEHKNDDL